MATINDDQLGELEALRSIYPTELTVEEDQESPVRLSIRLGTGEQSVSEKEDEDEDEDESQQCLLSFELPAAYPEVTPVIDLSGEESGIDEDDIASVLAKLNEMALENVGLPMVYTIASAAQEELNHVCERMKQKRVDEEARKKAIEDEKDRRRLEGTPVTVETFLAWKTKFDEEMGRVKAIVVDPASRRLTGKEQFLKDASLCTSDIRLIEESGEELKIDETLYGDADLDEAALSDNESDEETE